MAPAERPTGVQRIPDDRQPESVAPTARSTPEDQPQRRPPSSISISKQGLAAIAAFEGFRSRPYNDKATKGHPNPPGGNATVGYGHELHHGGPLTAADMSHAGVTREHALKILDSDIALAVTAVRQEVKVPLTQSEFDALVSFTYNEGAGALAGSDALTDLNAGRYDLVPGDFLPFDRHSPSLQERHKQEGAMFADGTYPPIPHGLLPTNFFP